MLGIAEYLVHLVLRLQQTCPAHLADVEVTLYVRYFLHLAGILTICFELILV